MLTPRRVPLLTPEISRSFGAFRIVNKEKYVMLNEKGLIFCTFCVIISGKAAGWCVKRLEGTFPDIPGERSSMPYSDKTIPPALRATSLFKGGLFPRIMSPLKRRPKGVPCAGMSRRDRGIQLSKRFKMCICRCEQCSPVGAYYSSVSLTAASSSTRGALYPPSASS